MELTDAIRMIRYPDLPLVPQEWADLGAGSGLFTRALGILLAPGSVIHAIDHLETGLPGDLPGGITIIPRRADFTSGPWDMAPLDGVLMANSLHYVKDQRGFLLRLRGWLKPAGRLLLVEYDRPQPVPLWVPYPLPRGRASELLQAAGFGEVALLATAPSRFRHATLYSLTASLRAAGPPEDYPARRP